VALGQHVARHRVDDLHLHPGHTRAEQRQAPGGDRQVVRVVDLDLLGDPARSTVSHTSPAPRRGKQAPIAVSAIPNAGNTEPGRKPNGSAAATNASTAFGSTGSAPLNASVA
jgi:hypothetical protein